MVAAIWYVKFDPLYAVAASVPVITGALLIVPSFTIPAGAVAPFVRSSVPLLVNEPVYVTGEVPERMNVPLFTMLPATEREPPARSNVAPLEMFNPEVPAMEPVSSRTPCSTLVAPV